MTQDQIIKKLYEVREQHLTDRRAYVALTEAIYVVVQRDLSEVGQAAMRAARGASLGLTEEQADLIVAGVRRG